MGWVGNLFIWYGLFRVGSKQRSAFLWTILGETIWVFYAAWWGWWDLAISCLVFITLAAHNYRQWGRVEPAPLEPGDLLVFGETNARHAAQQRAALASLERQKAWNP